jgi:hypothetical protein
MINEEWRDVPNYEGLYLISDLGNIKSKYTDKLLKPSQDKFGYVRFSATKNKKQKTLRIHRIVAEIFIPNPKNLPQVNHIDGNKLNCAKSNLEWSTDSENKIHAYTNGLMIGGNQYSKKRKDLPRYKLKSTNFN